MAADGFAIRAVSDTGGTIWSDKPLPVLDVIEHKEADRVGRRLPGDPGDQ